MITRSVHFPEELAIRLHQHAETQGVNAADFVLRLLDQALPPLDAKREEERKAQALAHLKALWAQGEEEEEEGEDPDAIFRAIDEHRPADQKLFPPELKGISW